MTENELQQIKKIVDDAIAAKKDGVCDHCGHCQHCGRGGSVPFYPFYPIYPSPWWQVAPYQPVWIGGGTYTSPTTITCGGLDQFTSGQMFLTQ